MFSRYKAIKPSEPIRKPLPCQSGVALHCRKVCVCIAIDKTQTQKGPAFPLSRQLPWELVSLFCDAAQWLSPLASKRDWCWETNLRDWCGAEALLTGTHI